MRVHRNRHERAFVVVPNEAARNEKLSLVARGLHVTLLSLPDGTKVTVESITDRVEEGRRTVARAFQQLEDAGYLRRDRFQHPESGLWCTETHISDLPTDRFPAVGEPGNRSVGGSPKGVKNQGKNLLPAPAPKVDGVEPVSTSTEEEGDTFDIKKERHPADAEVGQAAQMLSTLGADDRRLSLSTAEILRLAPLAAAWLAEGHSPLKVVSVLTARLPDRVDSAYALVNYRLRNQKPAKPQPKPERQPDTRHHCEVCSAPFPLGRIGTVCATCRRELDNAAAFLADTEQPAPEADEHRDLNIRGRALCRAAVAA
ncbi:helix-turn-helix domain-containing protein [Streptomyces sp. DT117]|uniref:helix-turn-helix domain-containing protein n=1 Tax=Streptomyces sp. DT117 TaxID=3393422 RepID=UPI003CE6FABB